VQLEALPEDFAGIRIDREVNAAVSDGVVALYEFANGVDWIEESDRKTESKESREHDDSQEFSGGHIPHACTIPPMT
jgi:hypothetical protein